MPEYRIEFSIQRGDGDGDFAEIGFGSSGAWDAIDDALYALQSVVQNRQWETQAGMPDPRSVDEDPDDCPCSGVEEDEEGE